MKTLLRIGEDVEVLYGGVNRADAMIVEATVVAVTSKGIRLEGLGGGT